MPSVQPDQKHVQYQRNNANDEGKLKVILHGLATQEDMMFSSGVRGKVQGFDAFLKLIWTKKDVHTSLLEAKILC